MSISFWLDQKNKTRERECDFLIVGSGIAGLSLAYWLEQLHPTARILILERHTLGFGASSRNGGFVTCGSIEHFARLKERHGFELAIQIWKFSDQNRELLKEHIIQDQGATVQFSQPGIATLAHDAKQADRFNQTAHEMTNAGIAVAPLSGLDIQNQYHLNGYHSGILFQNDGQIHPALLLQQLHKKISAELIENEELFHFAEDGTAITPHYQIKPKHTFLTLNAYLSLIAPEFSQLVVPQRGQVLVTAPIALRLRGPAYLTHHLAYLRQLPGGELLLGGFRTTAAATEETFSDGITPEIQSPLQNYIHTHFGPTEITHRWSGTMGFTPDHQMIIGLHPTRPHLSLMAGCSGHGMGLSFHAAKVLAESYSGKAVPAHLDIRRFETVAHER